MRLPSEFFDITIKNLVVLKIMTLLRFLQIAIGTDTQQYPAFVAGIKLFISNK